MTLTTTQQVKKIAYEYRNLSSMAPTGIVFVAETMAELLEAINTRLSVLDMENTPSGWDSAFAQVRDWQSLFAKFQEQK